ncbi:MAG: tRNA (adenosine(37)-N6)-dimethylallyltransferase MiaA [Aquiluna sp.]|nr:tRNA (adenosine(37)-N6)-dimethylallyltransferase MiaA [Aquiluna sp.]
MTFSVLAVVGPTASGKSGLGIQIAKAILSQGQPAEIINADAMQLYRGMDIGTAKLTTSEREGVVHHLLDAIGPDQEMTALEYQFLARSKAQGLLEQGITPIFVGGSMFYISAALDNLDFSPTDAIVRAKYEEMAQIKGNLAMHELLRSLDEKSAEIIPAENRRRVVRALEVIEITGESYPSVLPEPVYWRPTLTLGISVDRQILKERIASRVELMWQSGLLEEAEGLKGSHKLSRTAFRAIGYSQAFAQLDGTLSDSEAKAETISLTQRYARRQMSWFNRDKRIKWLDGSQELLPQALNQIRLAS